MEKKVEIIVAEDQALFRQMIIPVLLKFGFDVVGEASNGIELLELLKTKKPDIVLLDINMPKMDGNVALREMKQRFPDTKIIILTAYFEECLREDFIDKGADGFLTKNDDIKTIIEVIKNINTPRLLKKKSTNKPKFTKRELEIIPMMCESYTMKEIATTIGISPQMVEKHRQHIYTKTNSRSKTDFMNYVADSGLRYLGNGQSKESISKV